MSSEKSKIKLLLICFVEEKEEDGERRRQLARNGGVRDEGQFENYIVAV